MVHLVRASLTVLALGVLTQAFAASAHAQQRRAPATFFIVEGLAAYGVGSVFAEHPDGLSTGITVGVGGKLRGSPTRFYGVVNLSRTLYGGAIGDGARRAQIERACSSWSVGLRTLTPIVRRLRLLAELALGRLSLTSATDLFDGQERYETIDRSLLIELGLGLQYRFSLHFSLGAKLGVAIPTSLDRYDLIAELSGVDSSDGGTMNPSLGLTATLHL